jgi:NAD(P)H-binding
LKILLLGATGRTGAAFASLALAHGHDVRAMARRASEAKSGPEWVVGDVTSPLDIARALTDRDAIVSCLGQRSAQDAGLLENSAVAATSALGDVHTRRLIAISQGLISPSANPIVYMLRFLLARHVRDSRRMEAVVQAWGGDWTIARPPRLTEAAGTDFRTDMTGQPRSFAMGRKALARFLLEALETDQFVRQIVGLGST